MNCIKSVNLEIRVFKYDSIEERDAHVREMEAEGFKTHTGEAMLSKSSLVSEYLKKENWFLVAEYSRVDKFSDPNINYETDAYVF